MFTIGVIHTAEMRAGVKLKVIGKSVVVLVSIAIRSISNVVSVKNLKVIVNKQQCSSKQNT